MRLTHLIEVAWHIYASVNYVVIGSDSSLQDSMWTNAGLLLIYPLETTFSEIGIEIH